MKLAKLLSSLIGFLMVINTASAAIYTYSFSLDGTGGAPSNNLPGTAYGTLTVTDPSTVTLDITWSGLSSDLTKVDCFISGTVSPGFILDFSPATDLPTSGQWTDTKAALTSEVITGISTGKSLVEVGTVSYPLHGYYEIGGPINPTPIPEPSGFSLAVLAGVVGVAFGKLRKPRAGI